MNTTEKPQLGCEPSLTKAASRLVKSTNEALPTSNQLTLWGTPNAISLPESAGGRKPYASPDGQQTSQCGPGLAHANRSARELLIQRKERAIKEIFGRVFTNSSASASLQESLESKLRTQLAGDGTTEPKWTLKSQVTPLRQRFCEVTLSARFIKGNGCIGLATPAARDGKDLSKSGAFLAARLRHSTSMATQLLERGLPWQVISAIYCLGMGYPLEWNEAEFMAMETPSCLKSRRNSSKRRCKNKLPSEKSPGRKPEVDSI